MTQHTLQGRSADELSWLRRRSFLQSAAAWVALGGAAGAAAQQRGNVVDLRGDALINGRTLRRDGIIQTGDIVQTGPGTHLVFTIGNTAFLVRQNSHMSVERGSTLNTVSVLRLLAGGVASVWGSGGRRLVTTPTLTAGIRGTGVYTEVLPEQNNRSYFCNCYGVVRLVAGEDSQLSESHYHQSFWAETQPQQGRLLRPAPAINHTDEELEMLAALVQQRTAWQISGQKGTGDGSGH